jgi:hypothetical protein
MDDHLSAIKWHYVVMVNVPLGVVGIDSVAIRLFELITKNQSDF